MMTFFIGFVDKKCKITDEKDCLQPDLKRMEVYETGNQHRLQGVIDGLKLAGLTVDWTDLDGRGIL